MATFGYHASHEQFPPGALLDLAARAVGAGFDAVMCSDHFHPWSDVQGESGHAWSWLGASMQRTPVPHGVVTCPTGRYHPAVVAQAAATLAALSPGRFWLAAGSGEALNESITGRPWPAKPVRNARLQVAVDVMRALWRGETVDVAGDAPGDVTVRHARLYSRPPAPPPVFLPALTPETARWGASWADGLITASTERDQVQAIVDAFREGGGAGKPMALQVKLSWAADDEAALEGAMAQWRPNVLPPDVTQTLDTPAAFEAAAGEVDAAALRRAVRVSSDLERHVAWLREDLAMGFDALYLHNVNTEQAAFVDAFGAQVLPVLRNQR